MPEIDSCAAAENPDAPKLANTLCGVNAWCAVSFFRVDPGFPVEDWSQVDLVRVAVEEIDGRVGGLVHGHVVDAHRDSTTID